MVEKEFEKQIDKDNKQVKIFSPKYCKCGCGRDYQLIKIKIYV